MIYFRSARIYSWLITCFKFFLNDVKFHRDFISYGVPILNIHPQGSFKIGKRFRFNSGKYFGMGGRWQECLFVATKSAQIIIGDNVGLTSVAIVSHERIIIGNDVKIGINTVIYDTDFHSLDARFRNQYPESIEGVKNKPVTICDGVFIGGHSTILKGVTIGRNSIVGAGSVVFQSIPDEQVWAGNPAKYVRDTCNIKLSAVNE